MKIGGYLKTSLIEWPEKISSVVFTAGCNFRCPFCHNGELVDLRRYDDTKIRRYDEKEILKDLKKRKEWNDAVIITGGEPTINKDLPVFLKKIKEFGYLIMLHTNGSNHKMIELLFAKKLIDRISIDIKGDFENYGLFSGIMFPGESIKKSLKTIIKSSLYYELRTTVVPGLHNKENLIKLANQLALFFLQNNISLKNVPWFLQQFRPLNTYNERYLKIKPYSKEEMVDFQNILHEIIPQTYLRGV